MSDTTLDPEQREAMRRDLERLAERCDKQAANSVIPGVKDPFLTDRSRKWSEGARTIREARDCIADLERERDAARAERDAARAAWDRWRERSERLEAFVRDCRDNWDCDSDSHRYGTSCRTCDATALLGLPPVPATTPPAPAPAGGREEE